MASNNLYQPNLSYSVSKRNLVNSQVTNARLNCNKAHKTIISQHMNDKQEEMFIRQAEMALMRENRANSQRELRRSKR